MREQELFPETCLRSTLMASPKPVTSEEFGERCLIESLQQNRDLPCQDLLTAIVDCVQRYSFQEQGDDITAIVAKFS